VTLHCIKTCKPHGLQVFLCQEQPIRAIVLASKGINMRIKTGALSMPIEFGVRSTNLPNLNF
jgi:hypothetical protein